LAFRRHELDFGDDLPLQQRADLFDRFIDVVGLGFDELEQLSLSVSDQFVENCFQLLFLNN
jgi:hypothetical protein